MRQYVAHVRWTRLHPRFVLVRRAGVFNQPLTAETRSEYRMMGSLELFGEVSILGKHICDLRPRWESSDPPLLSRVRNLCPFE